MMCGLSGVVLLSILKTTSSACINAPFSETPSVPFTLVENDKGAVWLDGSPPSYYYDVGEDDGKDNWIIYLQSGGWCSSAGECKERSTTSYCSSKFVRKSSQLAHILTKSSQLNPEFCSWNRVYINYCNGSSFTGNVEAIDPATNVTYRGARIFSVIMDDLLSKGMKNAKNAIFSGSSAGGLATILHCDRKNLFGNKLFEKIYEGLITLHCFFPEYSLQFVKTRLFIIMSSFDEVQVEYNLSPQHKACLVYQNCSSLEMVAIQELRLEFLHALPIINIPSFRGIWITSCITHMVLVNGWTSPNSINNTGYSEFGDWFYDRRSTNVIDVSNQPKNCSDIGINP